MKRIIQLSICIAAFLSSSTLFAQSIERQVIAAAGGVQAVTGISVSSTSGEAATSSYDNASIYLNQGFQQGDFMITSLDEKKIHVNYQMYPNPTSNHFNLELSSDTDMKGLLVLASIEGKQIQSEEIHLNANQAFRSTYSLQNLPQGTYLLSIRGEDGNLQVLERVQKVN